MPASLKMGDAIGNVLPLRGARSTTSPFAPPHQGQPFVATLVYARRPDASVLLVQRRQPPFNGQWVAPGGWLSGAEAPTACAEREFGEETGLRALDLTLKGVIREVSPRNDFNWLLMLYRCCAGGGSQLEEARLPSRWWARGELDQIQMPEADRWWLPHVLSDRRDVLEATVSYDARLRLTQIAQSA